MIGTDASAMAETSFHLGIFRLVHWRLSQVEQKIQNPCNNV
jgi:hypothetical protein